MPNKPNAKDHAILHCAVPLLLIATLMAACQPSSPQTISNINVTIVTDLPPPALTTQTSTPQTPTPIPPTPTLTPIPPRTVWIDPVLPADLHDMLMEQVKKLGATQSAGSPAVHLIPDADADVVVDAKAMPPGQNSIALITRTFAVAAPFPTIADSITLDALSSFWKGKTDALSQLTNDGSAPTLFMDANTRAGMVLLMGEPAPNTRIQLGDPADLVANTWAARPVSFAILPFDHLEARWKLIWLDGINLFDKQADATRYPLTLIVRAHTRNAASQALATQLPTQTNRDIRKLAIVAMTGVTALVRGTAVQMERKGLTYPGEAIRDWLLSADVRHISNEVSFWDNCPAPTFNDGVSMCSRPKYMELLKYVGTNLIELSGNHLWDKGPQWLSPTLKMYEDEGWAYFAGGRTFTESQRPVTMTVAGNRLAFVGCNWFGADWATPTNGLAGSALCGSDDPHDLDLITPTIKALADAGYLVIATLQYAEFYTYEPTAQQARDFKALRDAGALVVSGSQGHHVQGFDVSAGGFIHYGVGNLFFGDQEGVGTHQTFVDRHAFYNGRYLGADLRSAFIEDYSKPVPMKVQDRARLLKTLFESTGY
jgi:poly-gamma-glutamate synthesis protein (capsule biosynthesis protein)